jgi:iron complex transport system permease protein
MQQNNLKAVACFMVLIGAFAASLGLGSSGFSLGDFYQLCVAKMLQMPIPAELENADTIFFSIRIPRLLVAALCGIALSAAGVLSQGLFRNALASPSVLGTEAGASFSAALTFYLGPTLLQWFTLPLAAFFGAFITTSLLLVTSTFRRVYTMENLLLIGFALNALFGALTSFVISLVLEDYQKFPAVIYWLLGGLNAKGWQHVYVAFVPIVVGVLIAYRLCVQLNVLTLGEEVAQSLSVKIPRLKRQIIFVVALLVGAAVSVAGALSFVGLVVPHVTRLLFGAEHRRLLIFSCVNGASLLLLADLAARTLASPQELQVGVIIALIGAPFFLWLLFRTQSYHWEDRVE